MSAPKPDGPSGTAVLRAVQNSDEPLAAQRAEYYRFMASVIDLSDRIPCGAEFSLGILLRRSLDEVRAFLAEHDCPPIRESGEHLLRHLNTWLEHTEVGAAHATRCRELMQELSTKLDGAHRPAQLRGLVVHPADL